MNDIAIVLRKLLFLLSVIFTSSVFAAESQPLESLNTALSECRFTFASTENVEVDKDRKPDGDEDNCNIPLHYAGIKKLIVLGSPFNSLPPISISRKLHSATETFGDYGFQQDSRGVWKFVGNPFSQCDKDIRFANLAISKDGSEIDYTLIGRQTENGCNQKGAPIRFRGAYIVRETPDYFVSVAIPYETALPKEISDQITAELSRIIKSIRPLCPVR